MSLEELKRGIQVRKPISFTYNKVGKTQGTRIGNPHAVWTMHKKDGSKSIKVHVVQTAGVSDSGQEFPSFRMFDLADLEDIQVLDQENQFQIASEYNPDWDGYTSVIAKI